MKSRAVVFSDKARADLDGLYEWIASTAGWHAAGSYLDRLDRFCRPLDLASQRGSRRDDIRPGLRVIGFERRLSVAFVVEESRVVILGLFGAGQDWETELSQD